MLPLLLHMLIAIFHFCIFPSLPLLIHLPSTHFSFVRILTSILAWFKAIHKVQQHNGMANSESCAELRLLMHVEGFASRLKLRDFTGDTGK